MEKVDKSIEVDVPVRVAYNQWTQFETFPRFMDGVDEVRQIDDTHLHWRATIAGKQEEWDVEITEQVALSSAARAGDTLRRLRAAGCGIAIDDFGTGANSLAYVHQLPVTRLKIDGSFIQDITTNKRSEVAVKGIVQLARDFVLQTVGEHVETREQADFLKRIGVDFGQGYLFGRPEPLDDAMSALGERSTTTVRRILDVAG